MFLLITSTRWANLCFTKATSFNGFSTANVASEGNTSPQIRTKRTKSLSRHTSLYISVGLGKWCLMNCRGRIRTVGSVAAGEAWRRKVECLRKLLLGAQGQRLGAEQDPHPCGCTGTSSGNCRETETCMGGACHTPQQPLWNHPSGHLGGWTTPWSAEEMLDGQCVHARTAHNGLLQKRLEENFCWIVPHVPPPPTIPSTTQQIKGLQWIELNCVDPYILTCCRLHDGNPWEVWVPVEGTLMSASTAAPSRATW